MIDAHTHIWTLEPERYPWQQTLAHVPVPTEAASGELLLREMDAAGVAGAVLVQPSVYGWDNSYLCDVLQAHPTRFAGVCLVDPGDPRAPQELARWNRAGCQGLRINLIAQRDVDWLLAAGMRPVWSQAIALNMSLSLQMLPAHAAVVAELAAGCAELTIIIDYLGPDAFHVAAGRKAVRALARRPNTMYKVLALGMDSHEPHPYRDLWPLYETAAEAFGAERLLFGTDFPHVYLTGSYGAGAAWLGELPFLDDAERQMISDTNPRRLWRFPEERG